VHGASYKRTEDDSAHFPSPNYEKYPGEWHYRVTYSDACVGALVCADATPFVPRAIIEVRERKHPIRSRMAGPIRILCVPACTSKHYSPKGVADEWPDAHVVIANSHPTGCGSYMVVRGIGEHATTGEENVVILLPVG
jgi:hypothetical protein